MITRYPFEYCGAIHVHSSYSDGTGEILDIITAGQKTGLDFIILTDHNTLKARTEGWEGWHKDLLLIIGEEISSQNGHCLAIGTTTEIEHQQSLQNIIDDIGKQKALSFLAHPHGVYRPLFKHRDHSWKNWNINSYTGLELWSYMFDWVKDFRFYRCWKHYYNPNAQITGPFPQTLKTWDHICQKSRSVCIGGVDAHARRYPLLPLVVFPYADLFQTLRTRIITSEPLSGSPSDDILLLLQALEKGNCFVSYDSLYEGKGTRFGSADGSLIMGDEQTFNGEVKLEIQLPVEAEITVLQNGLPFKHFRSKFCTFHAETPGVYRAEAKLEGKPWIFTNPVYLRSGA